MGSHPRAPPRLHRGLYLYWGIRLGLDLQGGIHLVVRVETDDALRAELDDAVKTIRDALEEKRWRT